MIDISTTYFILPLGLSVAQLKDCDFGPCAYSHREADTTNSIVYI